MDGKNTNGPNAVISMLHYVLENYGFGENKCILYADNCSGEYTIVYLNKSIKFFKNINLKID